MDLEDFNKKRWRPFEKIEFEHPNGRKEPIECMLLAVDFEQQLFKLEPFDKELYEDNSFWSRVEYCKRPSPKPRLVR